MASLPSPASWRRQSSQTGQTTPSSTAQTTAPAEIPETATSETESFLINDPKSASESATIPKPQEPAPQVVAEQPRLCWICQMDDTEDTPENSEWRTPCPCSLTAHDSCLLEWIASEEAPRPGEIARNHQLKCPQCQAEIKIQRPRDYLVAVVELIQRVARITVLPTALAGVASCMYSGLLLYGLHSMTLVFGIEETKQILNVNSSSSALASRSLDNRLRVFLGLPLIGPSLILLRTRFGETAFPMTLPIYFVSNPYPSSLQWPPSAGLTFATIPYIRIAYSRFYDYLFADLEKEWDNAVQRKPRDGETADEVAQGQADDQGLAGEAIFELEWVHADEGAPPPPRAPRRERNVPGWLGGNVFNNRNGGNNPRNQNEPAQVPAANIDVGAIPAEGIPAPNPEAQQEPLPGQIPHDHIHDHVHGQEVHQQISINNVAATAVGALFFPFISTSMGTILKNTLPAKWVKPTMSNSIFGSRILKRGLLSERWGRSVVGGCLFVVLKDVVTLYCKWKKARDFGKRKVLDYTGKRGSGSRQKP